MTKAVFLRWLSWVGAVLLFVFPTTSYAQPGEAVQQPWPSNVAQLRGLSLCDPDESMPVYGDGVRFTCHPAFPAARYPNFMLLMGIPFGASFFGEPEQTRAGGWDFEAELYFGRVFGVGVGYRFAASAPLGEDVDGDGIVDVSPERTSLHAFSAGLRLRLHTDEPSRRAWIAELGAAYARSARPGTSLLPSGPLLQLGISRQLGTMNGPKRAFLARLGVRFDQGLIERMRVYHALFVTARVGFEGRIPPPRGFSEPRVRTRLPLTFNIQLPVGIAIGRDDVGLETGVHTSIGFPIRRGLVEPRLTLGYERLSRPVTGEPLPDEGRLGVARRFLLGWDVRLRFPRHVYVEGGVGYRVAITDLPPRAFDGAFVVGGVGAHYSGCNLGVSAGAYYRWHNYRNVEPHELGLIIEFSFGTSSRTFPGTCHERPGANPRIETLLDDPSDNQSDEESSAVLRRVNRNTAGMITASPMNIHSSHSGRTAPTLATRVAAMTRPRPPG